MQRRIRPRRCVTAFVAATLFMAGVAHSAPIISATGLASPDTTITFNEFVFAPGTPIGNQYASLGVTFSPNVFYDPQSFGGWPGFSAPHFVGNFTGSTVNDPFSIFFGVDQSNAAFAFATNPGVSIFTALLNGVVVESFSTATSTASLTPFVGFQGILFDQILIDAGGGNNAAALDTIQLASVVPEPTSLLLLGTGAAVLLAKARRRKKQQEVQ